jgi:hypothetical protein
MLPVMAMLRHVESWTCASAPEAVSAALAAQVTPGPLLALASGERAWRGQVEPARFRIARSSITRNSFVPVVVGELRADGPSTRVQVELEPHPVMMGFVMLWTVVCGLIAAYLASLGGLETRVLVAFVALPLVAPAVALGAFRFELPRTLAALKAVLPARP